MEIVQQKAMKVVKAKSDAELENAKKEQDEADESYQKAKGLAKYLDYSIVAGIVVVVFSAVGILQTIFGTDTSNMAVYAFLVVAGFLLESFFILAVVHFHLEAVRITVSEKFKKSK
jgi:ABC-type transport system involved in cytochrome bd biosynthesis fused ATPase/permease subunit